MILLRIRPQPSLDAGDFMKWSEEYVTGIKRIDDHHKALFEMSEVFRDALSERRGERVYGLFLKSLRAYACAHIGFEEGCVERCQCPAAQQNTQAHTKFLQGLSLFEERYTMVGFERAGAYRVVDFVDQWLADHICRIDTQLKPYAQGL
ncbi:MAG: hemerythrin domain-containing protein [Terriglobales bacterium]